MRIWDVSAGYLARQQLLGEHRELHGLANILGEGKRGYARHPETLRWVGCLPALIVRHRELVEEMVLRGYRHHSPLAHATGELRWPERYIDAAYRQFELLSAKYADGRSGRIPLPAGPQVLWAQHKYSVMARDPALYAEIGPAVAHGAFRHDMEALSLLLVQTLRQPPDSGRLYNALQHMWGHVGEDAQAQAPADAPALLAAVRREAIRQHNAYLLHSTALSELGVWL